MRELIFQLLTSDTMFNLLVPADRVFAMSSAGVSDEDLPAVADGRFAFYSFQTNTLLLNTSTDAGSSTLQLNIYDEPGDYLDIDSALRAARSLFRRSLPAPTVRGSLMSAEWQGDSDDFFDDGLKAIFKTCTWRLVGTGEAFA